MLKVIDSFLNSITMYKVVLYGLLLLAMISHLLGAVGLIFYSPAEQFFSLSTLVIVCFITNFGLSKVFKAPVNIESWLITALILFFLLIPATKLSDLQTVTLASVLAMASKYFFAWNNKHIFNPAAFAAFVLGLLGNGSVIWWVGSDVLLPFVLVIGLLIVRKIRRFPLLLTFLGVSLVMIGLFSLKHQMPLIPTLIEAFTSWPLIFFGTVMLTEPLTMPPTKQLQLAYGALVGFFFGAQFEFGSVYSTPELALLIGNVFAFIVSPKLKLFLRLDQMKKVAADTYEYAFVPNQAYSFEPGQYLEWTLPHEKSDLRGNRRYFTIASSPTEKLLRLVVRIEEKASSYKHKLRNLKPGDQIVAAQLAGDFTLPDDVNQKLAFIAGGIGVTPFLSMTKYLMDKGEKRDIVLLYVNRKQEDIAYKDLFDLAQRQIGLRPLYVLTGMDDIPKNWKGLTGRINEVVIRVQVPDYLERRFFLSGPNAMVDAHKELLQSMGVGRSKIVTDYFPGF